MLEDIILIAFGTDPYFAFQPMALLGSVEMGGIVRDVYGLTLIGVATLVAIGCWWLLNKPNGAPCLKQSFMIAKWELRWVSMYHLYTP